MKKTRQRLIQINQPEAEIEKPDVIFISRNQQKHADSAEENVKNVVSARAAREGFFRRNNKTQNANQNQDRRENEQDFII